MNNNARKEKGHTPCHKNKQRIVILSIKRSWGTQGEHSYYSALVLLQFSRKLGIMMSVFTCHRKFGQYVSHDLRIHSEKESTRKKVSQKNSLKVKTKPQAHISVLREATLPNSV